MELLSTTPYELDRIHKGQFLDKTLKELTLVHYDRCQEYRRMLDCVGFDPRGEYAYTEIPFLPVSLFKEMELRSISKENVFKTLMSSGTTGQAVSKIFLDRDTASRQQKVLVEIVKSYTGASRCPMLIVDCPSVVKDRKMFSARGAGIIGFSIFGVDKTYMLNDDMELNIEEVASFLERHKTQKILIFGFTFMIWKHFYQELVRTGTKLDLSGGILIHGGGWKKLESESVSQSEFKAKLRDACGIREIYDYYGMVEQTGTVYMECEFGHLHASIYSDVITRRPTDFSICDFGENGIIQVVSTLASSYPGHSLLTEDEGMILGEDDCPCGRKGKYFKVKGRLKNAEIRGCSDTYASKF